MTTGKDRGDVGLVEKPWGHYKVLHKGDGYTVKELTILPGKSLSDQRHFKRDEHWLVVKGELSLVTERESPSNDINPTNTTSKLFHFMTPEYNNTLFIRAKTWHRPHNDGTENVVVVETWIGNSSEEDIERRNV